MPAPIVDIVCQLRAALDGLARALASGGPDAVLACELPIADAVRAVHASRHTVTAEDAATIRGLVGEARASLARCKRLGDTVAVLALATLRSPQGYGRCGGPVAVRMRATLSSRS